MVAMRSYAFVAFERTIWSFVMTSGSVTGVELREAAQPAASDAARVAARTVRHRMDLISSSWGRRLPRARPMRSKLRSRTPRLHSDGLVARISISAGNAKTPEGRSLGVTIG